MNIDLKVESVELKPNSVITENQVEEYRKIGIEIKRQFVGVEKSNLVKDEYCNKFIFTVNAIDFELRDSIHNFVKKLKPTVYDFLACITKHDPGSFNEFCDAYGYDSDSISAFKTYQDVCAEWDKVRKAFNREQLEFIREIN